MKLTSKQLKSLIRETIKDEAQAIYGDKLTVGQLIERLKGFDQEAVVIVDVQGEHRSVKKNDFRESDYYYDEDEGDEIEGSCVFITTWE